MIDRLGVVHGLSLLPLGTTFDPFEIDRFIYYLLDWGLTSL